MVHLYVFNPARKIRLLTTLLYRGSKRILASVDSASVLTATKPKKAPTLPFFNIALQTARSSPVVPPSSLSCEPLIQDIDYYKESESGSCIFQVESTLFKVSSAARLSCGAAIPMPLHYPRFIAFYSLENLRLSVICSVSLSNAKTLMASVRVPP